MKHRLQKLMALMLVTALLCCLIPLGATAEEAEAKDLLTLVGTSRSELYDGVVNKQPMKVAALAFRYRIDAPGLSHNKGETNTEEATVTFGGNTYQLKTFGVLTANKATIGNSPSTFVRENADNKNVTDIEAKFLLSCNNNSGEFIGRIINIPASEKMDKTDTLIYARPYFVYTDDAGEEVIVYGDIDSANASGKKVRYAVEVDSLRWFAGGVNTTDGTELESTKEVRTDFINNTDLLVRLPEASNGTPTAYVRAYYYSAEEFLSAVDVTANWTVLKDLGIPNGAVAVRLVAFAADGSAIADAEAFGGQILVTANKKGEEMPLTFQRGGLLAETGEEVPDATLSRTDYVQVQDLIVRPESGSSFVAYFYDGEKQYIGCSDFFMVQAKKLLDIAPDNAVYARFAVRYEEPVIEDDEYEEEPEIDLLSEEPETETLVPVAVAYFYAYLAGSEAYDDFADEAMEEETEATEPLPTEPTESTTTTESTVPSESTNSGAPTASTNTTKTTGTTKTTSTTKTTAKPTTTKTTKPGTSVVLTEDKPENQGVQNALWRMQQLVNISYTPLATVPQSYKDLPANVTKKGIPYSSTRIEQAYVPNNVSFHTFMTALQNPKSYLYTVDLGEDYGNKNGDTYYGTVCSTTCGYALGIVGDYTTYQWTLIPGMELLKEQNLQDLKLCDTIVGQGHVVMITGIWRDKNGRIVQVEVSESGGIRANAKKCTITALEERFPSDLYEYCRYTKLAKVTYTASEYVAVGEEKAQKVSYNTAIIPRKGDKANWRASETVILDVLNKASYTKVEIYKYNSGDWVKQSTKDIATTIKLKGLGAGTYRARLTNGTKTSKWCYWKVADVVSKGEHYQGTRKVKVSFSAAAAEPLFVQWMNGHTNATVRITQLTKEQIEQGYGIFVPAKGDLKVRVAFKTSYGIIYSELPEIITVR